MRRDAQEWSVGGPFRALLWWPAISFALAIAAPDAAVWMIMVAGLALAAAGTLVPAAGRWIRGSSRLRASAADDERPTIEIPRLDVAA